MAVISRSAAAKRRRTRRGRSGQAARPVQGWPVWEGSGAATAGPPDGIGDTVGEAATAARSGAAEGEAGAAAAAVS